MQITNELALPTAIVEAVKNDPYNPGDSDIIDISGCEGRYIVSDYGIVYSTDYRHTGRTQALRMYERGGYLSVMLYRNGKPKWRFVHRLVAETFISKPNGKYEINHINGDKLDNRVSNLEWSTRSENALHGYRTGLINPSHGESHVNAKLDKTKITKIREMCSQGEPQKRIAKLFGVSQSLVSQINTGRIWCR